MSILETAIKLAVDAHQGQTDKAGKPYPLARRVKELDLIDNMNSSRLTELSDTDVARMRKYIAALAQLRGSQG